MKGKASDICPKCKYCEGLDMFAMYNCKHYRRYPDAAIGKDCEIECDNFEEETNMNKVEGKVSDWCPKCKNCKGQTRESNGVHDWLTEVECEDPYDGMIQTLDADSDIRCSMFEAKKEKEPFNLNMPSEAIKAVAKLNDVICELEKEKSDHLKGIECLKKSNEKLQNQVKNLQTTNEESYKREEMLEEKLKKANELADSWKRDYEFVRDQLIHPIYDILYPGNLNRDINVTDFINNVKDLKVYADENGRMYKEVQEWREKCIARGKDIDHLLSENKEKDKKISELESLITYWSNKATSRCEELTETKKDRDKWRKLYNSLSETCADYDKRCKEECEKKYRDEISKLQNIVTEKEVELKKRLKDNVYLSQTKFFADTVIEKNKKLKQTISDQEVTIKALLITIKEMCKECETNE